jgi:hypothetical protein
LNHQPSAKLLHLHQIYAPLLVNKRGLAPWNL